MQDRAPVRGFLEPLARDPRLVGADPQLQIGDLLPAGNLDALAVLQRSDELARFQQALRSLLPNTVPDTLDSVLLNGEL